MSKPVTALLAALSGGLYVLGFSPFDLWPLSIVAAGALFWLLERSPHSAVLTGGAFALAKYGFGTSWVYVSINVYGNAPPPLAAFLVLLMVLVLSAFACVHWWLYQRLRGTSRWANGGLFVSVWVLGEWTMTWFLSGFPWLFLGYGQLDQPLSAYAPVGGVLLVSTMAALLAVLLVQTLTKRSGTAALAVLALFAGGWLLGQVSWTDRGELRTVALVQGNTAQATKWRPESRLPIIRKHLELSEPHWGADLVLWPEGAITVDEGNARQLLEGLDRKARSLGSALVLGLPYVDRDENGYRYYNAGLALGIGEGRYLKQHLVPFGEYVPFEGLLRGTIEFFDLPMSSMSEGRPGQRNLSLGGYEAALVICYEVAFPELMRRQASGADVLMTVSNDTWFGASIGPEQHMQISRMRALELGRWLLRGTNNGITAIVDERGRIVERLPQFVEGVLEGEFETRQGSTPYARFGLIPAAFVVLLLTVLGLLGEGGILRRSKT